VSVTVRNSFIARTAADTESSEPPALHDDEGWHSQRSGRLRHPAVALAGLPVEVATAHFQAAAMRERRRSEGELESEAAREQNVVSPRLTSLLRCGEARETLARGVKLAGARW
jgi:hypothetical protein